MKSLLEAKWKVVQERGNYTERGGRGGVCMSMKRKNGALLSRKEKV